MKFIVIPEDISKEVKVCDKEFSLELLRNVLSCQYVEHLQFPMNNESELSGWIDENGKLDKRAFNERATKFCKVFFGEDWGDHIAGPLVIFGIDDKKWIDCGLNEEEIQFVFDAI